MSLTESLREEIRVILGEEIDKGNAEISKLLKEEIQKTVKEEISHNNKEVSETELKEIINKLFPDLDLMISKKVKEHLKEINIFITEKLCKEAE